MKATIVVPAHSCGENIVDLYHTAMLSSDEVDIDFIIFLHSNHRETIESCEMLSEKYDNIDYRPYGFNRGLSVSWNDGMLDGFERGADTVIVSNDDIKFSTGDVAIITRKAIACRDNYMVSCAGFHVECNEWRPSQGYSCFALNPIALEKIGCFDQNLFPAYLEDIDHHRRATMLGLVEENCPDTNVTHLGSMTIKADFTLSWFNKHTQTLNFEYFRRKWDVINHEGGFAYPFNDDQFGLKIEPKNRAVPYPGYDRTDYDEICYKFQRKEKSK